MAQPPHRFRLHHTTCDAGILEIEVIFINLQVGTTSNLHPLSGTENQSRVQLPGMPLVIGP